jgi:hypothetical protein
MTTACCNSAELLSCSKICPENRSRFLPDKEIYMIRIKKTIKFILRKKAHLAFAKNKLKRFICIDLKV